MTSLLPGGLSMGNRFVVVIISLLTFIVMCGLLLAAIMWVPERIDRLDKRLDRLEELSAQVSVMHNQLSDLDKLEKKLGETALAAAPLGRIDASVDEVNKKLNEVVVPAVADIKGRLIARTDIDRVAKQLNEISGKLAEPRKSDPELKKLADAVAETKRLVESMQKKHDTTSRALTKDVKSLQLGLQKLEALIQRAQAQTQADAKE